ncbi:MAG: sugar ABC transporter substrate-binding protein [Blautia sp.]|nr:sugar ABC transporter substrate-binding protein [Blautia sp.]
MYKTGKRVLAMAMAATMMMGNTAYVMAEEPTVNVDTKKAAENNTWKMASDPSEYKLHCYWPAPDTFFDSYVLEGLEAFEADYGVDIDWMVGTEWTQDVENQSVEAKIAQGYDLFLVFGADTSGANALYQEIYDAGGQVVNYAGLMDDPQKSAATLASDVYVQAYNSTKNLIELMGGEGEIINVLEQLSDVNTQKRQQGVEDAVAEYENVSIAQTVADISTVDQGYEKISDALTANAGVKGIITTGGTASQGLANALADYYGTNPDADHIFAGSMDQSNEVMNAIENGQIDYTVAQNGWAMGYVSSLILCMLKDGWQPNEFGEFIDTGYIFINKDNADTWQTDIEAKAAELIGTLETDWFTEG